MRPCVLYYYIAIRSTVLENHSQMSSLPSSSQYQDLLFGNKIRLRLCFLIRHRSALQLISIRGEYAIRTKILRPTFPVTAHLVHARSTTNGNPWPTSVKRFSVTPQVSPIRFVAILQFVHMTCLRAYINVCNAIALVLCDPRRITTRWINVL
jgi:hypothetical protein